MRSLTDFRSDRRLYCNQKGA